MNTVDSINTATQAESVQVDSITTTVSFPRELWKRVKLAAVQEDTSAQQLCHDGLELILAKLAKKQRAHV